jgi:hypothetical protein
MRSRRFICAIVGLATPPISMATTNNPTNHSTRAYMQAMYQLKASVEDCLACGRVLSCLTLLYSAIDVLAATDGHGKTQKTFVAWVDKYMLPNTNLRFSALDLYAARCGIVHNFSAESDLSRAGKAKKLVYAWGTASADSLQRAGHALGRNEISVHVRDLVDGFGIAVIKYIEDVADHPDQHEKFFESTGHWLIGMDTAVVDEFLALQAETSTS